MQKGLIAKIFLIFLVVSVIYAVYKIFQPFLVIILASTMLATLFYHPYEQLVELLRGRKQIAALIMCILVAIVVILPLANFMVYTAQKSVEAYDTTLKYVSGKDLAGTIRNQYFWERYNFLGLDADTAKEALVDVAKKVNDWIVNGARNLIKGTTTFVFSLIMILFTLFFFFVDGKSMLERLMYWTPLPNKYDKAIFKKFQDVSTSTIISTFVTAIIQGIIGGIGFMIVGLPAFFAGIAMGFLSLLPYIGAGLVWFPAGIYLVIVGRVWQGVFLLIWGGAVISTADNLIRAYIIKDKAKVHPIFIIFSILGGIAAFGFWGVIFGPLIISLAVTILHIYELEYESVLER